MEKKNNKMILPIIIGLLMIIGVIGVTYAFFNYTRTGTANTLSVGRIYFNHTQDGRINLSDVFPIDKSTVNTDTKNVGTFEINIEGDTDYVGGIEYLVSATNTHITTSTGQIIPISLDISVEGLGTYENNYFTERENKNSKIYKRLTGNGIMGDGNLLVGYIPQNTTLGTPNGIDGTITIKAYIDQDKVAISDTYDGNETDHMGTTSEWVDERIVLTTEEWNAFQDSGISFQIKVEANEDIWVEETLYDIVERQTVMDNINSAYVNNTTPGIDFSQISSDTNGKGVYTLNSTANDAYPIIYYRGEVTNNNVLFANKCWKMVRTTDTGGVKLIYNGENKGTSDAPNCDNIGTDTQITLNIDGQDVNTFAFNENANSPAYVGYMYGAIYKYIRANPLSNAYFGNGFEWDGDNYILTSPKVGYDGTHHYTCNLASSEGTCTSIRYYFHTRYYINLSDGKSINDALIEMSENLHDSNAKSMLDTWYEQTVKNTTYERKLEDIIWCNDRSIYYKGAWNPNGNETTGSLVYSKSYLTKIPTLYCKNKDDRFTVNNLNGNKLLDYPVAMLTSDEIMLAGGKYGVANQTFYLNSGTVYLSLSPLYFDNSGAFIYSVNSTGVLNWNYSSSENGLRPVLSLKNDTTIVENDADGTVSNPYIVK